LKLSEARNDKDKRREVGEEHPLKQGLKLDKVRKEEEKRRELGRNIH